MASPPAAAPPTPPNTLPGKDRIGANATCGPCPKGTKDGNRARVGAAGCVALRYNRACPDPCKTLRGKPAPRMRNTGGP